MAALVLCAVVPGHAWEVAVPAGGEVGADVPAFYVREVTGRRPDLATCLVCRYGSRPVVTICVRQIDTQAENLLAALDRTLDAHRGDGLRGFALFVSGTHADLQPQLTTLARRRKLSLPLSIPVETGGPSALGLNPDAATTVLFYQRKKIVARYAFAPNELTAERIQEVAAAADRLCPP